MRYLWIDDYALSLVGSTKDFKEEWQWFRYLLKDKMFLATLTNKYGKDLITLKCDPLYSEILRSKYEEIEPGYYMNKKHWISIDRNGNLDDELLRELITKSHELVWNQFSKKIQTELRDENL